MAQHDKYFPTGTVSRNLPPGERSFVEVVHQQGKRVTDADLNLAQDLRDEMRRRVEALRTPSGFVRGVTHRAAFDDFTFPAPWLAGPALNPDFVANAFRMRKLRAVIAGFPVTVEYSNIDTEALNLIQLDTPPLSTGAPPDIKRTDFVFLEAWFAIVEDSLNAVGSFTVTDPLAVVAADTVTVDGVVLTAVAAAPGVNEFLIGVDAAATAANLASAIDTYVTTVRTLTAANVVQVIALASGTAGNTIALASSNAAAIVRSGPTLTGGTDTSNKPGEDLIYRHGNVDSSTAVALPDDLVDPNIPVANLETSKRIQLQYRIRVTSTAEAVNFQTQADGFSNASILAQGTQGAPVAGYNFVPADRTSVVGSSSAVAYDLEDSGLWIAGAGDSGSATDLGTLDGFVYAMPIAMVFRRNDATATGGWNPEINTNGALLHDHATGFVNGLVPYTTIDTGESDRPDGYFADAIVATDVLDLRRHVNTATPDLASELEYQMQALLDGTNLTWAIDAADKNILGSGSGDVSTQFLVCDQIGRQAADGGVPPLSGTTTRGNTIRNFDHIARRFGDQSVVERVVFEWRPGDSAGSFPGKFVTRAGYAGGFSGWAEDDEIHLDLSTLNASSLGDFDPAGISFPAGTISSLWPAGTQITDVISMFHDDGNYGVAVPQEVQAKTITGMGTDYLVVTLDANETQVNGGAPGATSDMVGTSGTGDVGSPRRIFIEVEITYPLGEGLTDTPDLELTPTDDPYLFGPFLENDPSLGQRPDDMEAPLQPEFREGFREVLLEYVANDPDGGIGHPAAPIGTVGTEELVSRDALNIVLGRRAFGSNINQVGVTDSVTATAKTVDNNLTEYGSSSRLAVLDAADPLSGAGQTLVAVTFYAQDPIPNYGGAGLGYQVGVYYRSNAPQTAGTKAGTISTAGPTFPYSGDPMPASLDVEPLLIDKNVWTGQVGMGSVQLPFPYVAPLDQLPINDGRTAIPPTPGPDQFPGEWYFAATALTSISDFEAETGLLSLHPLVQIDGTQRFTFGGAGTDEVPFKDAEFRSSYPVSDPNTYRPTAMAQPLSGVVRHKTFTPMLVKASSDCALWRKGELLLVVLVRWAEIDEENTVRFLDTDNRTCAAVYRTKNLMVLVGDPVLS